MSDLFGNHIVGFPTRRLIYLLFNRNKKYLTPYNNTIILHQKVKDLILNRWVINKHFDFKFSLSRFAFKMWGDPHGVTFNTLTEFS